MTATSQNGFPALPADSPHLHTWVIPGSDVVLRLRDGSAGFLLIHLAVYFDRRVEDIDHNYAGKGGDDWAYAYRPVRGYETTLSNHASGTAMDLNATDHPMGRTGTFTADQEALLHKRLERYAGCIRAGLDYRNGRPDPMHFEINQPLAACEKVARGLLKTPVGRAVLKANPGQKAVILS